MKRELHVTKRDHNAGSCFAACSFCRYRKLNISCLKCEKEAFKWLLEEYKEPILNEDEKKILRGVIEAIKPFIKISPLITRYNEAYGQTLIVLSYENEYVRLPLFNRDKMFTNLEYEKSYTLKELGL